MPLKKKTCWYCKNRFHVRHAPLITPKKAQSAEKVWNTYGIVTCPAEDGNHIAVHGPPPENCYFPKLHHKTTRHPKVSLEICAKCQRIENRQPYRVGYSLTRGIVACHKDKKHRVQSIYRKPPDDCPYSLDHLMTTEETANAK